MSTSPKFITLTDAEDGTRRRINASAIAQYLQNGRHTLVLSESGSFSASEKPEQIDALLGVTPVPLRDAAPDLLAALAGLIAAHDGLHGASSINDAEDAARAAIAKARGEV
jgi:hypothetical protein